MLSYLVSVIITFATYGYGALSKTNPTKRYMSDSNQQDGGL